MRCRRALDVRTGVGSPASASCLRDFVVKSSPMSRIVLPGGRAAGKPVISRRRAAESPARFALGPEAAPPVYAALRTPGDRLTLDGAHDVQRRICRLQVEQE